MRRGRGEMSAVHRSQADSRRRNCKEQKREKWEEELRVGGQGRSRVHTTLGGRGVMAGLLIIDESKKENELEKKLAFAGFLGDQM
jgi:hypothetical protein